MGAQTPQWVPSTMAFANLAQSVLVLWLILTFTQKRENKGYFWVGLTTKIGQTRKMHISHQDGRFPFMFEYADSEC